MKKLLTIVVLGLVWCGNVNAKIILFKNCAEKKDYEKWEYKINTYKKNIQHIRIYTDNYLKYLKETKQSSGAKITKIEYFIDYYNSPYLKGVRNFVHKSEKRKEELDFILNNKIIIQTFTYGDGSTLSAEMQCE